MPEYTKTERHQWKVNENEIESMIAKGLGLDPKECTVTIYCDDDHNVTATVEKTTVVMGSAK